MAIKFYSLSFYMYEEAKLFILNSVLELLVVSKVSETSGNYIKKIDHACMGLGHKDQSN